MDVKLYPAPLAGTVAAPPSKSRWHRELICQAAAGRFPPVSPDAPEDIRATAAGLRVLYGGGEEVPCGASGSTLRFLLPLAMTLGREVTFTGTPRLLERVMPGLWGVTPCPGGLRVTGRLTGGVYRLPGGDTSQLISGMLMALPLCREDSRLEAPGPVSRPYVDLTAWVLERYGVVLHREKDSWRIPGGQRFAPLPMEQEGDWSAAAYWLVLAALGVLVWLIYLTTPMGGQGSTKSKTGKEKIDWSFLHSVQFWLLTGLLFCQNAAEQSVTGWMVTYFKGSGIITGALAAYTVTVMWGATLVARLLIAFVFPFKQPRKAMVVMGVGCTIFYFFLMQAHTQGAAILLLFAFAFAMAGMNPTAVASAGKMTSVTSMGIMLPAASSGAILMPWIIGRVAERAGLAVGMACNIVPCIGLVIFAILVARMPEEN